jgi:PPOX class probable F420-dependent enzyme
MELPADVWALFEAPNYAHLATVLPDGSPHTVPLWVGIADGKIAFLTSPDSRKARNIAADPRVAISVTERGQPFTMAQVRGQVTTRLDGDEAWTIIDEISRKVHRPALPAAHRPGRLPHRGRARPRQRVRVTGCGVTLGSRHEQAAA